MLTKEKSKSLLLPAPLPPAVTGSQRLGVNSRNVSSSLLLFLLIYFAWVTLGVVSEFPSFFNNISIDKGSTICPQANVLIPERNGHLWRVLSEIYRTDGFQRKAIEWLGGRSEGSVSVRPVCVHAILSQPYCRPAPSLSMIWVLLVMTRDGMFLSHFKLICKMDSL